MAGLQRSAVSFRRQGSSGFVWDDRFLTEELNKVMNNTEEPHQEQDKGENEIKELRTHHHPHLDQSTPSREAAPTAEPVDTAPEKCRRRLSRRLLGSLHVGFVALLEKQGTTETSQASIKVEFLV
ncbi:hypothetical protein SESBI_19651 [Sesbania bispinosa]|nr:hypothetical protein SESBI_19651 [Sesbania bispinosa]